MPDTTDRSPDEAVLGSPVSPAPRAHIGGRTTMNAPTDLTCDRVAGLQSRPRITSADIDREAKEEREDARLLSILAEWQDLFCLINSGRAGVDNSGTFKRIAEIEGLIIHCWPNSAKARLELLRLAHQALAMRDLDEDTWFKNTPVTQILSIVYDAS